MLGNDELFPITVGLSGLLNQGASQPAMYTLVITGALLSIIPLDRAVPAAAAVLAGRPRRRRREGVSQRTPRGARRTRAGRTRGAPPHLRQRPDLRRRSQIHWPRERAHSAQAADDPGCRARGRRLSRHGVARPQRRALGEPDAPATPWSARSRRPATASTRTRGTWRPAAPTRSRSCSPSRSTCCSRTRTSRSCMRGAAEALADRELPLVLLMAGSRRRAAARDRVHHGGHVDGVLLVSSHRGREGFLKTLVEAEVPVVACGVPLGLRAAHRLRRGRRPRRRARPHDASPARLGAHAHRDDHRTARHLGRHRRGSTATAAELGDAFDERARRARRLHARERRRARCASCSSGAPDLDAVFVASDVMAAGRARRAARRAASRVPERRRGRRASTTPRSRRDLDAGAHDDAPAVRPHQRRRWCGCSSTSIDGRPARGA